jgi:chemotaxis signal transduction protein
MRVVLYSNNQTNGAVRVEEVIGMIEVERAECRPLPSHFQQEERTWISGTTIYRDQLVLILSPEWVLGELGEVVGTGTRRHALSDL